MGGPWLPLLLLAMQGCATTPQVRELPPDEGARALYDAPVDEVTRAVPAALRRVEHETIERGEREGWASVTVGKMDGGLWPGPSEVRVLVREEGDGRSEVRVASSLRGRSDRMPPQVLRALDRELGPEAMVLEAGMRAQVHVGPRADDWLRGPLRERSDGSLFLLDDQRGAELSPAALGSLPEAGVLRGSYRHTVEGLLIGTLAGLVLAPFLAPDCGLGASSCDPLDFVAVVALGQFGGALVGSAVRTEVWSPLDPGRGR